MDNTGSRVAMLKSWAMHDASVYRAFTSAMKALGCQVSSGRVLDIGCGSNAPMTLMLHSAGIHVTGIDHRIGYRWGLGFKPSRYVSYLKEAGPFRTVRKAIGELVYDRHYYATLAQTLGFPLTEDGVDLRETAVEQLPFEENSFDIVYSNATWEHFSDVEKANRELARVLKPGGTAYIEIHLFPSLSGGHDLPWIVPGKTELGNVVPWGHLRNPSWKAPVYLNRLREADYRRLFERTPSLEIIDWQTEFTEGEHLVTDDILKELHTYSREELTKRSIIVILRKRSAA
jgi:SAM-dependent methyltransferase